MFGLSTAKLIGGLAALLILAGLFAERGRWMHRAHNAEAENATVCAAIRAAADNPKMDCKRAAQQAGLLGQSIADLKAGIAKQNAAVIALAVASAKAQDDAKKAVSAAKERVKAAQTVSDRLSASANDPARKKQPCEPSKVLQDSWR